MLGGVGVELLGDMGREPDAAVFAVFGVVLDQEPVAGGVEAGDQFDGDAADGERSCAWVEVGRAQFDEFGPAQSAAATSSSPSPPTMPAIRCASLATERT
jgi:hypothetical protein